MTVLFIALCFKTALVLIVRDVEACVHPPQMQNQTLQERCVTNGNHFLARHLGLVDFVFFACSRFCPDQLCDSSSLALQTQAAPKTIYFDACGCM